MTCGVCLKKMSVKNCAVLRRLRESILRHMVLLIPRIYVKKICG